MGKDDDGQFTERTYPVKENMGWIKKSWALERIGFFLLGLFILYALLGGVSQGWLSDTTYHDGDSTTLITYEKYLRSDTESPLVIIYPLKDKESDHITLQGAFINVYDITNVSPQSSIVYRGSDSLTIYPHNTHSGEIGGVQLTLKPRGFGVYTLKVTTNSNSSFTLKQIVFP